MLKRNVDYDKIFKNKRCQRDINYLMERLKEANRMFEMNKIAERFERELIEELDKEIAELDAAHNAKKT